MTLSLALGLILGYFGLLLLIAYWTGRGADSDTFFTAGHSSPWYVVAFGMIGASLSGITFISVPGAVGVGGLGYGQMVLGYLAGYAVIGRVLLPLYYRLGLTSIYGYLSGRYGVLTYRTGSVFFMVSRVVGAALRLYLVIAVLQLAVGNALGVPFWVTVLVASGLTYAYTFRAGIKTVVWADILQTVCMLGSGVAIAWALYDGLRDAGAYTPWAASWGRYTQLWHWGWGSGADLVTQFLGGAAIAVAMTGLDQDMMQKNLTCRSLGESRQNMFWFCVLLVLANALVLWLGVMMYRYGEVQGLLGWGSGGGLLLRDAATGAFGPAKLDDLLPTMAMHYLGPWAAVLFVVGIIAATFSGADSALTALTTAVCYDLLGFERRADEAAKARLRTWVHLGFAGLLVGGVLLFRLLHNESLIWTIFTVAGYTYGPLLGLYAFGLLTARRPPDGWVPLVCVLSPVLSYGLNLLAASQWGWKLGSGILLVNALLTVGGLNVLAPRPHTPGTRPRGWEYGIILLIFALNGTTTAALLKPLMAAAGLTKAALGPAWYYTLYIVLLTPLYNALLLAYAGLFGRYPYFRDVQRRWLRMLLGRRRSGS